MRSVLFALVGTLLFSQAALAETGISAFPGEIQLTNSMGRTFKARLRGSAHYNWYEDERGYSFEAVALPANGDTPAGIRYYYVAVNEHGDLIPLGVGHALAEVGSLDPEDIVAVGNCPTPEAVERARQGLPRTQPKRGRPGWYYHAFFLSDGSQIGIPDAPVGTDLSKMGLILRQSPARFHPLSNR